MQIRISGLEQVQRRLREAPRKLVAGAYAKAINQSIGVLAAEVEARTPEGPEGLLKESVITEGEVDEQGRGAYAVCSFSKEVSERSEKPMDLIAYWVEYGHQQVSHDGKKTDRHVIGHVPAHPFMRPALDAAGDRAIEVFAGTLIDSLSVIEEG